jgi:hypothetical protein
VIISNYQRNSLLHNRKEDAGKIKQCGSMMVNWGR